jgi:1-acyl-sn-glycerol-3-phosphate acyltransferase
MGTGTDTRILGRLARIIARGLARVYYPNIEISGRERLPAIGPLLLAANHQNSLMDPVMIGIASRRPVRFLAKAPLFQIPIFGNLLHALGMMPAYRRVDDPSQTRRNLESLSLAAAHLRRGEAVGIFPEGRSHDAPRIEGVKTGAARIAIQAAREGAEGLTLVPVGINYQRKEQFRSAVWIRVGEPIDVNAWLAGRAGDDRQLTRELTAELDQRLKELVVHLDEASWEPLLEDLEVLLPPPSDCRRNPFAWLRQRKRLADAMNYFIRAEPARAEVVADLLRHGHARLEEAGLTARSSVLRQRGWRLTLRLAGEAILMDLGFIVVLIGTLHHLPPFLLTRGVARCVQAPGRSTAALARFGLGVPIYGAWYALHAWWISSYFLPWVAWAWLLPMPFAGLLALHYWRRVKRTSPAWWRNLSMAFRPARLDQLRTEHNRLRELLQEMAGEYSKVRPAEPLPRNSFSWRRLAWGTARWATVGVVLFMAVAWLRTTLPANRIAEMERPAPELGRLSPEGLAAALDTDERTLAELIENLTRLESGAAQLQAEFASGRRSYYTQADDDAIRQAMLSYLACRTTLLGMVWKYQKQAQVTDARLRWRAFLVSFAAASAISDSSLKLVTRFAPHPPAVRKLNEADAAWGIPPGAYDMVKRNLLQSETRDFMEQSLATYQEAQILFARLNLLNPAPFTKFHDVICRHAETREDRLALLVGNRITAPFKEAARMTKGAAYRGQAFVSTWLGSTRFRKPRDGRLMIRPRELAEFHAKLKPGDILIERQNWFLSRAFMPGYWAHAALYVGTTNDLVRLGLDHDPRVMAQWKQYAARNRQGHEHLILEAVPEGVRMTTLEHCIGVADAAAVLRPRVNEEQVREAIARAFSHLGKSYDFDFDFFSSDKLVCTELVYRCYDGSVQFPLVDVMGRRTLPPTELVRKFVTERGHAHAQLDCICFLDGDENQGMASFKDESVFATTLERPGLMLFPETASP